MPLDPDQMLNNRYRIIKLLGQGGFGAVYRAWDNTFDLPCAIKENVETGEAAQRQFLREARLLHTLRHPNLPLVKDYFVIPGQGQYLVMDFVEGEDLHEILVKTGGPLPEAQALAWVTQICEALIYLHTQNPPVIHRDIKPANIKITPEGKAMLVDFGIAKQYDPSSKTTQGAQAVTPGYSPPEQYGDGLTDVRSDIYALGATLCHLLSGQKPMDCFNRMMHHSTESDLLAGADPAISPHISAAVEKAMQFDSGQRFASIEEFRRAISFRPDEAETKKIVREQGDDAQRHPTIKAESVGVIGFSNMAGDTINQTAESTDLREERCIEERVLEAAIASQVKVGEAVDLTVMIRKMLSAGLRDILERDEIYTATKDDIRSKSICLEFRKDKKGVSPVELLVKITAPDFQIDSPEKTIAVYPDGDSEPVTFMLIPEHQGELKINVEVYTMNGVYIAARMLRTNGKITHRRSVSYKNNVVYLPLRVNAYPPGDTYNITIADSSNVAIGKDAKSTFVQPEDQQIHRLRRDAEIAMNHQDWLKVEVCITELKDLGDLGKSAAASFQGRLDQAKREIELQSSRRSFRSGLRRWIIGVIGILVVIAFIGLSGVFAERVVNNRLQTQAVVLKMSATALAILPPSATPIPPSPTPTHTVLPSDTPTLPPSPTITETPAPTFSPTPTETSIPTPPGPVIGGADKVAFLNKNEVWVANLDGSDLVQLTNDELTKSNLQWTPDGKAVNYISGKCVYSALLEEKRAEIINCFTFAQYFKAFEISPDGKQVALSIDNQLYIVPYDLNLLRSVSVREALTKIATCKDYAPYRPFFVKFPRWSRDGKQQASIIMGVASGVGAADTVMVISLERCTPAPDILEKFPPPYFMPVEYKTSPMILNFGWDGYTQFALATFIRNSGFGKLYTYNSTSHKAQGPLELISECCYRDPVFSPDGKYLLFAYQKYPGGDGNIQLYLTQYGTLGAGGSFTPLPLPPIDPKSQPQPALRKVP